MTHLRRCCCAGVMAVVLTFLHTLPTCAQVPTPKIPAKLLLLPTPSGHVVPFILPLPLETVTLTREQYQELMAKIERLQAQLETQKAVPPRECELEVRFDQRGRQGLAKMKATFKFQTTAPRMVVPLGCKGAQAIDVKLADGKIPTLLATDDGLAVQIETPSEHHSLTLDLEAPISLRGSKGTELGFEIGLPASPITKLAVEAPANVKRYSLTTKMLREGTPIAETEQVDVERLQFGKGGEPLGAITSLQLLWDDPKAKVEIPRSAETDLSVTVGDDEVVSIAKIRLRGTGTEWRFVAPSTADVTVSRWSNTPNLKAPLEFPSDRAPNLLRPEPGQSIWKIQFRDPPTTDVLATITVRALRPRTADPKTRGPFPIGPFDVLDIPKQNGVIRIKTPLNTRAAVALKGDTRRDADEEISYRYARVQPLLTPNKDPYLELTLVPFPGSVSSRMRHEIRMHDNAWRLRSEISVAPTRAEIEVLDLEVPAMYQALQAEPRELVEGISTFRDPMTGKSILRLRLNAPKTTSFTITLEGEYRIAPKMAALNLPLPHLVGAQTREHEVLVFIPPNYDVRGQLSAIPDPSKPSSWFVPLEVQPQEREPRVRASSENSPIRVELQWQPLTSSVSVRTWSDVDCLSDRALVTQRLTYRFAGKPPAKLHLVGERPLPTLRSSGGPLEVAGDGWDVAVPSEAPREWTLTLHYTLPLPPTVDGPRALHVVRPEQPDAIHTARFWTTPERHITIGEGEMAWSPKATEIVEDRATLPDLVLQVRGPHQGPLLNIMRQSGEPIPPIEVANAWIEVLLQDQKAVCRTQLHLARWTVDEATVLLTPRARNLDISIQGSTLKPLEGTTTSEGQRPWRVRLPVAPPNGLTLEIRYELPVDGVGLLPVPTIEQATGPPQLHWRVLPMVGSLPLLVGGRVSGAWSARALLSDVNIRLSDQRTPAEATEVVLVTGPQTNVRFVSVPRMWWTIGCSVVALLLGIGIALFWRGYRRWLSFAAVVLLIVTNIYVPQIAARLFGGALPGLLALVILLLITRALRWRYQRRLARLPSFAQAGTTLVRPSKIRGGSSAGSEPVLLDPH